MIIGEAYLDIKGKTDQFNQSVEEGTHNNVTDLAKKAALWFGGAFVLDKGFDLFKGVLEQGEQAQKSIAQTAAVIKSTGDASGVTGDQISKMTEHLSNLTGVDDDVIRGGANLLLTFTNIRNETGKGNDIFNQATKTVQDMATALGEDTKSAAIQLGKALNDPVQGATALRRVGVQLTDQQKEQIKTLVGQNNLLGAQKIVLGELSKEFGGSAEAQATSGEKLKATFHNIEQELGLKLLPVFDKLFEFIATLLPPAMDFLTSTGEKLSAMWKDLSSLFMEAFGFAGDPFGPVGDHLTGLETVTVRVARVVREIWDTLKKDWNALVAGFKGESEGLSGGMGIIEQLGGVLRSIADFVEDHFKPILIGLGVALVTLFAPWAALTAAIVLAYEKFQPFHDLVQSVVNFIDNNMKPVLAGVAAAVAAVLVPALVAWAASAAAAAAATIAAAAPVIALVAGIGLLVGALVYAYDHWQGFHDAVDAVVRVLRDDAWPIIEKIASFMEDHWKPILLGIAIAVGLVIAPVAVFAAGLIYLYEKVGLVHDIVDTLAHILMDVLKGSFESVKLIIENFIDTVQLVIRVVTDVVDIVKDLFTGKWGDAWDHFRDIPMAIIDFVTGIVGNFLDYFKTVPGLILDAVGDLVKLLYKVGKDVIQGLWDGAVALLEDFIKWEIAIPMRIVSAIGDLGRLLYDVGGKIISGLRDGAEYVFTGPDGVIEQMKKLPGRILEGLGDLGHVLTSQGSLLLDGLAEGAATGLGTMLRWSVEVPLKILQSLGDLPNYLRSAGGDLMSGLWNGFVGVYTAFLGIVRDLPGNVIAWIGDAAHALWGTGGDLMSGLWNGFVGALNLFLRYITSLPGNIAAWIGDAAHALWGVGSALMSGLWNGFVSGLNAFLGYLPSLPGNIVAWIGDVFGAMYRVGSDVIRGLLRGLIDAGRQLFSGAGFIGNWAYDHLIQPFINALGIGSPSKLFMGFGQNIAQGLAHGISSGAGLVNDSLSGIGDFSGMQLSLSGTGMAGFAGVSSSAGAPVIVQIDLTGAMITADSVSMLRDIVTSSVLDVFEAVDHKSDTL